MAIPAPQVAAHIFVSSFNPQGEQALARETEVNTPMVSASTVIAMCPPCNSCSPLLPKGNSAQRRVSCCQTIMSAVKRCARGVFTAIKELWGKKQDAFERHPGLFYQPGDEAKTGSFNMLMPAYSQRENWYKVTPYIAEFWCCLSSATFIHVGIVDEAPEFIVAGIASIASHAVPLNWLLCVDKLGALVAATKIIRCYYAFAISPWLVIPAVSVGIIFAADVYHASKTHINASHIVWHPSAAYGSHLVFQTLKYGPLL